MNARIDIEFLSVLDVPPVSFVQRTARLLDVLCRKLMTGITSLCKKFQVRGVGLFPPG